MRSCIATTRFLQDGSAKATGRPGSARLRSVCERETRPGDQRQNSGLISTSGSGDRQEYREFLEVRVQLEFEAQDACDQRSDREEQQTDINVEDGGSPVFASRLLFRALW